MDINDLNKLSVTALFAKLTAQPNTGNASSSSFASLLGQTDVASNLKPRASENAKPVKNDTPVNKADDNKASQSNNKKDVAKTDDSNAKDGTKKEVKVNKSKPATDKGVVADKVQPQAEDSKSADLSNEANIATLNLVPLAEPLAPIAEAGGVDTSELVNIADSTMADGAELGGDSTAGGEAVALPTGALQISDENGAKLEDYQITPENLAKMSVVTVVDAKNGEMTQMSGAELAAKLLGEKQSMVTSAITTPVENAPAPAVVAPVVNAEDPALATAPISTVDADKFMKAVKEAVAAPVAEEVAAAPVEDESKLSTVAVQSVAQNPKAKAATSVVEDVAGDDAFVTDEVNDQSEKLAQILDGKQVKVDVKVEGEKISYRNGQDLFKDRAAVDKAVLAATASEASSLINPAATSKITAAQPIASPMNATPIAVAAVQNLAGDDGMTPVSVAVSEIGSANTASNSNVHLSGSEFASATKADANAKASETSFKDIYKGMSKEAVEQVKVNITKSAVKGVDTIDVRLKPEDLGHIEIKMQIKDGKLQAHIISNRPETMEALQKDAQVLEKAFNDAGFQTDENSLSFSFRGDDQANQHQERNSELRNFIGDVFEAEANEETLNAEAANQNWSAEKGLNIKV